MAAAVTAAGSTMIRGTNGRRVAMTATASTNTSPPRRGRTTAIPIKMSTVRMTNTTSTALRTTTEPLRQLAQLPAGCRTTAGDPQRLRLRRRRRRGLGRRRRRRRQCTRTSSRRRTCTRTCTRRRHEAVRRCKMTTAGASGAAAATPVPEAAAAAAGLPALPAAVVRAAGAWGRALAVTVGAVEAGSAGRPLAAGDGRTAGRAQETACAAMSAGPGAALGMTPSAQALRRRRRRGRRRRRRWRAEWRRRRRLAAWRHLGGALGALAA